MGADFYTALSEARSIVARLGKGKFPPQTLGLLTEYEIRVGEGARYRAAGAEIGWSHADGLAAIDSLVIGPALPYLRILDIPCNSFDDMPITTEWDFTDYDIYSVSMAWLTLAEAKNLKAGENQGSHVGDEGPSSDPTFDRHNPKDWRREEEIELNFLATLSVMTRTNHVPDALALCNLMVRHKAKLKGQWITYVPSFVEIAQSGRMVGFASYNGRYRYAVARTGFEESYFYITVGMRAQFEENGKLRYSADSGRTVVETNYPGRKHWKFPPIAPLEDLYVRNIGGRGIESNYVKSPAWLVEESRGNEIVEDPPILSTRPTGLLEPPPTTEQQIKSVLQAAVTFIVHFVSMIFDMLTFDAKGAVIGLASSAVQGKDATPKLAKSAQNMTAGTEAAYRSAEVAHSQENSAKILESVEYMLFDPKGGEYAQILANLPSASPQTSEAQSPIGWANRLFDKE